MSFFAYIKSRPIFSTRFFILSHPFKIIIVVTFLVYAAVVGVVSFAGSGYEWASVTDTHYEPTGVHVFYEAFVPRKYNSQLAKHTWKCEKSVIRQNEGSAVINLANKKGWLQIPAYHSRI